MWNFSQVWNIYTNLLVANIIILKLWYANGSLFRNTDNRNSDVKLHSINTARHLFWASEQQQSNSRPLSWLVGSWNGKASHYELIRAVIFFRFMLGFSPNRLDTPKYNNIFNRSFRKLDKMNIVSFLSWSYVSQRSRNPVFTAVKDNSYIWINCASTFIPDAVNSNVRRAKARFWDHEETANYKVCGLSRCQCKITPFKRRPNIYSHFICIQIFQK